MSNYNELRRLAQAGDPASCANMDPELVIDLITENELLERTLKRKQEMIDLYRNDISDADRRIKNHFETIDTLALEIDLLKAQCEDLRKDAGRYRWLRDGAGYCDTRDIPGMAPARMDSFIDSAMGNGEQP